MKHLSSREITKKPSVDAVAVPLIDFGKQVSVPTPGNTEVLPRNVVAKQLAEEADLVSFEAFDEEPGAGRIESVRELLAQDFTDSSRKALENGEAVEPTVDAAGEAPHESEEAKEREKNLAEQMKIGFDQGYQDGLARGQKEGEEKARVDAKAHFKQMLAELNQLAASVEKPLSALDEEVVDQLVILVKALVKQLVRREIKTDAGQIVGAVRQAMDALPANSRNVHLQLNPQDIALVREAFSVAEDDPVWTIVEVPSLARGNCLVETDVSVIDMTLDARLDALFAQVFGGRTSDN